MNWQIDWGTDPQVFGFDFAGLLAEGIEIGMDHLEYVMRCGHHCDCCGHWRITHTVEFPDVAPTDRGEEVRLLPYQLCDWCDPAGGPLLGGDDLPF